MMNEIVLDAGHIRRILGAGEGRSIIDLPCSATPVEVSRDSVLIGSHRIAKAELAGGAGTSGVLYRISDGTLQKLQFFRDHIYKLAPTAGYPALEIDGIRMHRSKDIPPEEEARVKVDSLSPTRNHKVLDICTGLGYTAQELARRGSRVVTLEKDPSVVEIAGLNPCSADFFSYVGGGQIGLLLCDAARFVGGVPDGAFDRVIHDPPTLSLAGELYSREFYHELHRIIRSNGILLHYTGQPGSRYRRKDLRRGVSERLRSVGFRTEWVEEARSVKARRMG